MEEIRDLVHQLIGHVARLSGQMAQMQDDLVTVKQDLAGVKQDLRKEMQTGFSNLETIMIRFVKAADEDGKALRTQVDNSMERRTWLTEERVRKELHTKYDDLERRIAELEAAERKRQQGQGA